MSGHRRRTKRPARWTRRALLAAVLPPAVLLAVTLPPGSVEGQAIDAAEVPVAPQREVPAWSTRPPGAYGFDRERLGSAFRSAASLPNLTSLVVARHGRVVGEAYWDGMSAERTVNVKSVSKSVLSALVGIALREGHIESLDEPVATYLPEYFDAGIDPRKRRITLRNLLTMRSGLETTSFGNYGAWVASRDWVGSALARPVVDEPGGRMIYSTGSAHVLSAVLTQATGMSTLEFARRHLFQPLGVRLGGWQRDPGGIYFGGNNMRLSPRALFRFGQLYLNGGHRGGHWFFPPGWVEESWTSRVGSRWNDYGYGYYWWSRTMSDHRVNFAWGFGGQYVFVVPDLELVVVATSDLDRPGGRDHRSAIHRLVAERVIPAAEARPWGPLERQPGGQRGIR